LEGLGEKSLVADDCMGTARAFPVPEGAYAPGSTGLPRRKGPGAVLALRASIRARGSSAAVPP